MKHDLLLAILFASQLLAFGELTKDELKQFKGNLEIAGARTDSWQSEDRKKFEVLEVNTFQSEDDPLTYDMSRFRLRLVVELTDKEKNTYLVQFTGNAPEDYNSDYKGEDYWKLNMAHGDLERLKISGYIAQYGIMDEETFVSLAEEEHRSKDMLERVRARTTLLFPGKVYLRHHYMYHDKRLGGRGAESTPVNIRPVKE